MINNIKFLGLKFSQKSIFYTGSILLALLFNYLFLNDLAKYSLLIPVLLFAVLFFFTFKKYYLHYYILSLGVFTYLRFDYRIQFTTLVSIGMIFLFITFKDTETFNNLKYPYIVKLISILLTTSVFASSILSKFASFQSVTYAIAFSVYILVSYVIFRSVKNIQHIDKLINLFIIITVISTIIDIGEIILTGNLRAAGIMGFAIMDFTVIVLLIFIFRYYLLGKTNIYIHISALLVFLLTIFHQSRFAWLGFILSLVYGIFVTVKYMPDVKNYFRKRAVNYVIIAFLLLAVVFVFGFQQIILSRVSQINFEFFQGTPEEGQYLSNSLESRLLIWFTAYNTFIDQPFFGVGYFMFPIVSEKYNTLPTILYSLYVENLDAHTTYFNFLVDTGIIGFSLFLSYFIVMFKISFKSLKLSVTEDQKSLSIVLNIYCFFVLVHSVYSGAFSFGLNSFHMWLMFALNLANYVIMKNNRENEYKV